MTRFENVTEPLPGFVDVRGAEMQIRRYLESTLAQLFTTWGYEEVSVPIVERASSFSEEVVGGSPWPEWDRRGVFYLQLPGYDNSYSNLPDQLPALLVPEGTISVSRWIAKMHASSEAIYPRKFFYVMPCFRNELLSKISTTKRRQFHQAGVEILGTENRDADIEILLLAHRGLSHIGVPADSIRVRLGSVALFNHICQESGLSDTDALLVKDLMDTIAESRAGKERERLKPSIDEVKRIIDRYRPTPLLTEKWRIMTETYADLLSGEAMDLLSYVDDANALNKVAEAARSEGVECVVDLSVVRSHEYYTGVVYELDILIEGEPPLVEVAGGGRYDRLVGKFLSGGDDSRISAVGFAYGLERLESIRLRLHSTESAITARSTFHMDGSTADLVLASPSTEGSVHQLAAKMRESGQRVDVYVGDVVDEEHVSDYASRHGATVWAPAP